MSEPAKDQRAIVHKIPDATPAFNCKTGNNTDSGGTNIFSGTLVAGDNNSLGSGRVGLFNGTLRIPMLRLTAECAMAP